MRLRAPGRVLIGLAPLLVGQAGWADPQESARCRELFQQECARCHAVEREDQIEWAELAQRGGPSLAGAGARFRPGWIAAWLVEPYRIRPAGYLPFRHTVRTAEGDKIDPEALSSHPVVEPEAAKALEAYLQTLKALEVPFPVEPSSSAIRASVHFEKLLPCGGCHRAQAGAGGVSGPDLTRVAERLRPDWLRAAVWDPPARGAQLMPKSRLRADQLNALAAYLEEPNTPAAEDSSFLLSPEQTARPAQPTESRAATIYRLLCSQCHGLAGDGRGINAPYLFVAPRDHSSTEQMSQLTDEDISRAIRLGGAAVGKSTTMPAWGAILDDQDIELLVEYLRQLSVEATP